MSAAIEVQGLGKRYRIGTASERHDSLRDLFGSAITAPIRNLRRVRKLSEFEDDGEDIVWALRDVSFTVAHGEVIGVIGRNGAGKSTLLKILSRITQPSAGRAVVRGRVGSLLEVGTGFHPDLTGRENVYLNGSILGMDRSHVTRRFDEIVEFAGIERFIDTPVKRYSSGMYLRLAFAVAAHLEPEILIVDEVLAVGDAQFQKKCLGKMSTVSKEGRTVLFVSHNLTAVRSLCSRALLLRFGTVSADTTASDAVSRYVAEISDAVMNVAYHAASAPHNGTVRVDRIRISTQIGEQVQEIDTSTPFRVEMFFTVLRPESLAGFTVILIDAENNIVFSSPNTRESVWYGKPMPAGAYVTSCTIPGCLLNAGWYTVSVNLFGVGFSDQYLIREALRLEVQDSDEVRGDYFGPLYGSVRPKLEWQTRRLDTCV